MRKNRRLRIISKNDLLAARLIAVELFYCVCAINNAAMYALLFLLEQSFGATKLPPRLHAASQLRFASSIVRPGPPGVIVISIIIIIVISADAPCRARTRNLFADHRRRHIAVPWCKRLSASARNPAGRILPPLPPPSAGSQLGPDNR